jgi:serine/threonine protein kinase/formylglycine-generating enzyme required for sulfatase activity
MKECPKCNLCFDDSYNRCPHDDKSLIFSIACETTLGGRYFLERKLGKGGMGSVFKGKHKFLKSSHAIKIISPEVVKSDSTLLVRFHQEAVLAASIHHPNVVSVTDFGVESENIPFLVMEYIDGISLADFLSKEKRLAPEKAYEILEPIALGVRAAHQKGITHRDLKPLNVMLKNGNAISQAVKVLDFGLAKIKTTESFASLVQAKTTNLLGSPHYIPPEQWENANVDNRSDIYSLGIILFQMLAGDVPFKGDSIPNIMYQHLQVPPPSFGVFGVSVSQQIESVICKALAKKQDQRYATVDEFLLDYEKAVFDENSRTTKINNSKTVNFFERSIEETESPRKAPKKTDKDSNENYNLPYLNSDQNKSLASFFNQPKPSETDESEKLERQFIYAQNRVEEARTEVSEAEKLALEFNQAHKAAEDARLKFLKAQQKLEEDVRRQLQAEMESKLAAEIEARKRAETEAQRLVEEAKARKEAEERANQLAKTALEAQQRAEAEQKKAEKEIQQRQLEEGTRRKAEGAALKLAVEVAEAKKKYEEAKREAEYEARFRFEAESKLKQIEEEIQRIAKFEAEKRKIAEKAAAQKIKEQTERLEQQALEADKKAKEARKLAESESQRREQAEAARKKAEKEARRLAEEIIEAQKRLEEAEQRVKFEAEKRVLEESARRKAEESARFLSQRQNKSISPAELPETQSVSDNLHKTSSPNLVEETLADYDSSSKQNLINTSSTFVLNTNQIFARGNFNILLAGIGVFVFFLISGASGYLIYRMFLHASQIVENIPNNSNSAVNSSQTQISQTSDRIKNKMVKVEGGIFQMGSDDIELDSCPDNIFCYQYPAHRVEITDFYIDRTEVTNEEYAEFVQDAKGNPPENWQNGKPPVGQEQFPVTSVSHFDAVKFADWITRRDNTRCQLPTEAQWEYAARSGKRQNIYPWGNEWIAGRATIESETPKEVGTTGDKTEVGNIEDMLGNVMELTSSPFDYYRNFPENKKRKLDRNIVTVRGASFEAGKYQELIKNNHLLLILRQGVRRNEKLKYIGFRLTCFP